LQGLAGHLFFALIRLLPITAASGLGGWIGRTIGPRLGVTKRARGNLRHAFPEMTGPEIETIVRDMWDNLGRTVMEYPLLGRIRVYEDDAHVEDHVEVVGAEHLDNLRDDGKPGIFFSGHLANWEIPAISITRRGLKSHLVYRAPNNPYVNDLFRRRHLSDGTLIPKGPAGARLALKALANGGHLGMLVDQKMNDGIAAPLFGRDAMTAPALAQLALKFDCPVVPVRCERLGGVSFRITCYPPLDLAPSGDREADVLRITTQVNSILEGWIRERPAQWLWLHSRWPD
jgi:KDO2-lipid IV(A) lauroyltransferase